jgi:hypothetical protein
MHAAAAALRPWLRSHGRRSGIEERADGHGHEVNPDLPGVSRNTKAAPGPF